MANKYTPDFITDIDGIPCGVVVTNYHYEPPYRGNDAPSDLDFYGYYEFEYFIVDSKGYKADWLEAKLTDMDYDRLLKEYEETL